MGSNPTLSARKQKGPLVGPFCFPAECGMGSRTLFEPGSGAAASGAAKRPSHPMAILETTPAEPMSIPCYLAQGRIVRRSLL